MTWLAKNTLLLFLAGSILFLMVASAVAPVLETKFWPVYSTFKIVSLEPYGQGKSLATFEVTKLRLCEPYGSAWYSGEIGEIAQHLQVEVLDASPAPRPLGTFITGKYVIDVTPDVLRSEVFAEIYSRCNPFWVTRSVIFP